MMITSFDCLVRTRYIYNNHKQNKTKKNHSFQYFLFLIYIHLTAQVEKKQTEVSKNAQFIISLTLSLPCAGANEEAARMVEHVTKVNTSLPSCAELAEIR